MSRPEGAGTTSRLQTRSLSISTPQPLDAPISTFGDDMFEFQAHRDDPDKLLDVLERFTRWWFHAPPGEETGVSEERLSLVTIPQPLRRLYAFAGEWPGGTFESIFSHQDHLAPFECLQVQDGKLVFAWAHSGGWTVATDTSGDDPPVYLSADDGPFELFCHSLSQFLVTFCLSESIFGAPCLSGVDDLDAVNESNGKIPIPLWLDAPYPDSLDEPVRLFFFLVDGCILQMNGWCGGRLHELDDNIRTSFRTTMRTGRNPSNAFADCGKFPICQSSCGLSMSKC